MPLTASQLGMIGEHLLCAYAVHGSGGDVDVFRPSVDDNHRDMAVARRGDSRVAFVQVKTSSGPNEDGVIMALARWPRNEIREHPSFLYAILVVPDVSISNLWLVPSRDFNRVAYHEPSGPDHVNLIMEAYPDRTDRWSPFQIPPLQIGTKLLAVLDELRAARLLQPSPV